MLRDEKDFRPDIQGLRGLAVLLVVIYHAGNSPLSGGFIGVDVFFVISGYVITALLARKFAAAGARSHWQLLVDFYARRMKRLLPAAIVVTLVTLGVGLFLMSPLTYREITLTALAATLFSSNFKFAFSATDYLGQSVDSDPFLHTWSLGIEEQFYLLWPFLVLLAIYFAPGRKHQLALGAMALAIVIVSYEASVYLVAYNQPWAFFSPWSRAWEFGSGALAFVAGVQCQRINLRWLAEAAGWAGLAAIGFVAISYDDNTTFPGASALIPCIGTALLLLSPVFARESSVARLFSSRLMVAIGDVSYSWYLWHWPAFTYANIAFGGLTATTAMATAIGSLVLAFLTLHLVENPFRFGSRFAITNPGRGLRMGLLATMLSAMLVGCFYWNVTFELNKPAQRQIVDGLADKADVFTNGCHLAFRQVDQPDCRYGPAGQRPAVILFGDSHAAHWFPLFERLANEQGFAFHSWTKSACPSFIITTMQENLHRAYRECDEWRESRLAAIIEMRPALVVLSNAFSYTREGDGNNIDQESWRAGIRAVLARLDGAGIPVVVLGDTPWPGFNVPQCLSRQVWRGRQLDDSPCRFDSSPASQIAEDAIVASEVEASGTATFIATRDLVCKARDCPTYQAGSVAFFDHSHLTASFARTLAVQVQSLLADWMPMR